MANESQSEILKVIAKTESAYGDAIATTAPAAGTDDVLCIDSPVPVGFDAKLTPMRPHSGSNTITSKDGVSMMSIPVNFKFPLMGSTAVDSATANGFKGELALLKSAQCAVAVTSGTGPVRISPAAVGSFSSVGMQIEEHGILHSLTGMFGNFAIDFDPDLPAAIVTYSGRALWASPSRGNMAGSFVGPDRSEMFLGVTGGIQPRGGSKYNSADGMQLLSARFDRGAPDPAKCKDAFSTYGIARFLNKRPEPKLTIVMKYETGSTNLTYADLPDDLSGRTDHGVEFMYGTSPAKTKCAFPTAQLRSFRSSVYDTYRIVTCEYLVRSSTAQGEFYIDFGNPSLSSSFVV